MDGSLIFYCLYPETFGQTRLEQSRVCHLKDGSIRTLSYAIGLGRVRYRAVYGYITTGGKLGNRSILSSVVDERPSSSSLGDAQNRAKMT
jgi:hypothetical protein